MYLKKLSLINFKNYNQLDIDFSPKINCFVGNNGVGKTNLLDAIYYMSFCKSYFNSIDSYNIKHNTDFFVIQGNYFFDNNIEKIYCGVKRNQKKQFKRNKKEYPKLSEHIGLIPLIMASPFDSNLIMDGSEERRKLINGIISQYDKEYLEDLIKYNRALSQRNKLLKNLSNVKNIDKESIEIWDIQLVTLGNRIYSKRIKLIKELSPIFQKYYEFVSGGKEKIEMIYNSQLHEIEFNELLKKSLYKDRILQYTTVGIHRDDLVFKLNKYPVKRIGSQGQQKTFLVALKLAKFDYIKQIYSFKPILLLDDIFDKLDINRVDKIIKLVADNNFGQIFITDTNTVRLKNMLNKINIEYKLFNIENENGNVKFN